MQDSWPSFEIQPGVGIGPFKLGMTCAEAREVARREFATEVQAWGRDPPESADWLPNLGFVVSYDANGRCVAIQAQFGYTFNSKSTFLLFGEALVVMEDKLFVQLCRERWPDVTEKYTGVHVPSAGLKLSYYNGP